MTSANRIADNFARIGQRIARAAERSGRTAEQVTLVAVTKYAGVDAMRALVACGCTQLGESRPQALWEKAAALADLPIAWHLVGHLQRNKTRRTLPLVSLVHSVDSPRLLTAIDDESASLGCRTPVLVEVNVSGEAAKHGVRPEELADLLAAAAPLEHIEVRGLMTMAGMEGGPDRARRDFARLRILRDAVRSDALPLGELSMGMSGDFEQAILEGATLVRIGSALFESSP